MYQLQILEVFETASENHDLEYIHRELLEKSFKPIAGIEYEKEDLFLVMSRLIKNEVNTKE